MKPLVELVPNISEGRNQATIKAVVDAATSVEGVYLLGVDSGWGANRTVITLLGEPELILESAFRLTAEASRRIDMNSHVGVHPCIGSTDVCPFVPYQNISLQQCGLLAQRLASRVCDELSVPVYIYGTQAVGNPLRSLPAIRRGGFNALANKLSDPVLGPDLKPKNPKQSAGATIIGARDFLVAFNVNLTTANLQIAQKIAGRIRTSGYTSRDGTLEKQHPGLFANCLAIGWFIEEYGIAQVSTNLLNFKETSMYSVFSAIARLAQEFGTEVSGSELVGLAPEAALANCGLASYKERKLSPQNNAQLLVHEGVRFLGLSDKYLFVENDKVLEWRVAEVLKESYGS